MGELALGLDSPLCEDARLPMSSPLKLRLLRDPKDAAKLAGLSEGRLCGESLPSAMDRLVCSDFLSSLCGAGRVEESEVRGEGQAWLSDR